MARKKAHFESVKKQKGQPTKIDLLIVVILCVVPLIKVLHANRLEFYAEGNLNSNVHGSVYFKAD